MLSANLIPLGLVREQTQDQPAPSLQDILRDALAHEREAWTYVIHDESKTNLAPAQDLGLDDDGDFYGSQYMLSPPTRLHQTLRGLQDEVTLLGVLRYETLFFWVLTCILVLVSILGYVIYMEDVRSNFTQVSRPEMINSCSGASKMSYKLTGPRSRSDVSRTQLFQDLTPTLLCFLHSASMDDNSVT